MALHLSLSSQLADLGVHACSHWRIGSDVQLAALPRAWESEAVQGRADERPPVILLE